MEYKLAKQLKEARFPQKLVFGDKFYYQEGQDGLWDDLKQDIISTNAMKEEWLKLNPRMVKIPTLSELIEACGDYFQLTKWNDNNDDEKWIASEEIYYDDSGYQNDTGKGKTPEEAVARLYIKLNEK